MRLQHLNPGRCSFCWFRLCCNLSFIFGNSFLDVCWRTEFPPLRGRCFVSINLQLLQMMMMLHEYYAFRTKSRSSLGISRHEIEGNFTPPVLLEEFRR